MENRKGNGIFLGIVSIATLIVAIIGATFAYFSASTESNEDAVNFTAYEFKLSLSVSAKYPVGAAAIIPLKPDTKLQTADGKYVKYDENGEFTATESTDPNAINLLQYALNDAERPCVDDQGLQVCALYEVIIENQATNSIVLNGQLKTTKNNPATGENKTAFKNLTYLPVTGNPDDGFTLAAFTQAVTLEDVAKADAGDDETQDGVINISSITVPGATTDEETGKLVPGKGYGYVLIYLNDSGDQSSEMGATYEGQLIYSSGEGESSKLTGSFTLASNKVQTPTEPNT